MRISSFYIAKLGKSDNITTDVLIKVCVAMDCHLDDIMETVDDDESTYFMGYQKYYNRKKMGLLAPGIRRTTAWLIKR